MSGIDFLTGMKQHTFNTRINTLPRSWFQSKSSRDRRRHCVLGLKSDILACMHKERLQRSTSFQGQIFGNARLWVCWLKPANKNIAFAFFKARVVLKMLCFKQCRFKYLGNSSGVRDITPLVKWCLFLFSGSSSQTCLDCVRFQTKSQPHKTSAFCLGDLLTPGSQGCHFTRGLSWGGCGGKQ